MEAVLAIEIMEELNFEDQIQVQKPILVVATDQMPDHIKIDIIKIDSNITDSIIRKVINV